MYDHKRLNCRAPMLCRLPFTIYNKSSCNFVSMILEAISSKFWALRVSVLRCRELSWIASKMRYYYLVVCFWCYIQHAAYVVLEIHCHFLTGKQLEGCFVAMLVMAVKLCLDPVTCKYSLQWSQEDHAWHKWWHCQEHAEATVAVTWWCFVCWHILYAGAIVLVRWWQATLAEFTCALHTACCIHLEASQAWSRQSSH